MQIDPQELYGRTERERDQLQKLKETVKRVSERVPFYREKLQQQNVRMTSLQDVRNLPFTIKQDLRDSYPFGMFAVGREEVARIHASSGTSGKSTVVGYTKQDLSHWGQMVSRAIRLAGGKTGDLLHNAYGYGLFTGGLGLHAGGEALGVTVVPASGGQTDRQIQLIQDFGPTILCSTPSYALHLGERMKQLGLAPENSSLQIGIFGAEPWTEEMRAYLEELFGIKACDIYGLSEVVGPGVAMECYEAQNGLHIAEDHFLVEVIDPLTLEPVPEGEEGELVFTSLTKEAFPILRYRTGDIASVTREPCLCGRTTARMSRVKGRIDDMLVIRGVNVYPSEIEHQLLQVDGIEPHYQVKLTTKGTMTYCTLFVERSRERENINSVWLQEVIKERMKTFCLITMDVEVVEPFTLPRSLGKASRIVDERKVTKVNQT